VAHLNDGTLRRMLDDPDAITAPDREHFSTCAECQARQEALGADARQAAALLAVPAASFDAGAAYKQITAQPARPRFGFRLPLLKRSTRPIVAALALAVMVAVVATASVNVSQIFAPQTVTPVPVTLAELQTLPDLSAYGDITWTNQPTPQIGITKLKAEEVAGFSVPNVDAGTLPAGISSTVTYAAMGQTTGVFKFSAAKAQAAAAAKGKTIPAMPAGMDGSTLDLTMGPALLVVYGDLPKNDGSQTSQFALPQLIVAESKAPSVTSTGVSVKELEDYLLAQPGISPQLAADIRAIGNPTTTLPIPVPIQFATSSKVTVHDVQGVALGDNTGVGAAVIWIKGNVFFVGGSLKQSDAIAVANGLH
jgi:hypothetical protein